MQWGSTTINYYRGSYKPPSASAGIQEIAILPEAGSSAPASVLQQAGRGRKRTGWDGFVVSQSDYDALLDDHLDATQRTFTGPSGVSLTCIIETLSPAEYIDGLINYSIVLVEA